MNGNYIAGLQVKSVVLFLFLAAICTQAVIENSLVQKQEVVRHSGIETENGVQNFVGVEGMFVENGSNFQKLFAKRPFTTTLWSQKRRMKCYTHAILVSAQQPLLNAQFQAEQQRSAISTIYDLSMQSTEVLASLDFLKTNYFKATHDWDRMRNSFSSLLRDLNAKSRGGVPLKKLGKHTNLYNLGTALEGLTWAVTLSEYAMAAGLQHALASDAALQRVDEMRAILQAARDNGCEIDMLWFDALDDAESTLTRDSTYYGALLKTIEDNATEIASKGINTVYPHIIAHFHKNISHYVASYLKTHAHFSSAKAATIASHAAVYWTWSLIATYETIDTLLNQHEQAQMSVAAATLDDLLHQGLMNVDEGDYPNANVMILQNQYTYFQKMEKMSSGVLPAFHDEITDLWGEADYKAARKEFDKKKIEIQQKLLHFYNYRGIPQSLTHAINRSILVILDTSDSMTDMLQDGSMTKIYAAKEAVKRLFASAGDYRANIEWALMIFKDCGQTPIIQPFTKDVSEIQDAVTRIRTFTRTPLAQSILEGAEYMSISGQGDEGQMVLLSDGMETCGGDPIEAARSIGLNYSNPSVSHLPDRLSLVSKVYAQAPKKMKITLNVISLDTSNAALETQLRNIALAANGKYYEAANLAELTFTMKKASGVAGQGNAAWIIFGCFLGIGLVGGSVYAIVKKPWSNLSEQKARPLAYLTEVNGVCRYPLYRNRKVDIGRAEGNDIIIQNPYVSEFHVQIHYSESDQSFVIQDLNSTNHTYLNDARVRQALVNVGDEVRIFKTKFRVEG